MSSPIERVLALCDHWDSLSKGETPTTRQIREAIGYREEDHEMELLKEQLRHPAYTIVLPEDPSCDHDPDQLALFGEPSE